MEINSPVPAPPPTLRQLTRQLRGVVSNEMIEYVYYDLSGQFEKRDEIKAEIDAEDARMQASLAHARTQIVEEEGDLKPSAIEGTIEGMIEFEEDAKCV
jgi:hypothetical protein